MVQLCYQKKTITHFQIMITKFLIILPKEGISKYLISSALIQSPSRQRFNYKKLHKNEGTFDPLFIIITIIVGLTALHGHRLSSEASAS
jgi:hypothetical protein